VCRAGPPTTPATIRPVSGFRILPAALQCWPMWDFRKSSVCRQRRQSVLFSEQKPQCRRAARRLIGPRLLGRKVARRATGLSRKRRANPLVQGRESVECFAVTRCNHECAAMHDSSTFLPGSSAARNHRNVQTPDPLLRKESNTCSCRSKLWKSAVANVYSTLHIERSDTRA